MFYEKLSYHRRKNMLTQEEFAAYVLDKQLQYAPKARE